jgi:hypothetical protein
MKGRKDFFFLKPEEEINCGVDERKKRRKKKLKMINFLLKDQK